MDNFFFTRQNIAQVWWPVAPVNSSAVEERTVWRVQQSKPSVLPVVIRLQFLVSVRISFLISSFIEHKQNRISTTPFLKNILSVSAIDNVKRCYLKIVKLGSSLRLADSSFFWCSGELDTFWMSDLVYRECNAFLTTLEFWPWKENQNTFIILKCAPILNQKRRN